MNFQQLRELMFYFQIYIYNHQIAICILENHVYQISWKCEKELIIIFIFALYLLINRYFSTNPKDITIRYFDYDKNYVIFRKVSDSDFF